MSLKIVGQVYVGGGCEDHCPENNSFSGPNLDHVLRRKTGKSVQWREHRQVEETVGDVRGGTVSDEGGNCLCKRRVCQTAGSWLKDMHPLERSYLGLQRGKGRQRSRYCAVPKRQQGDRIGAYEKMVKPKLDSIHCAQTLHALFSISNGPVNGSYCGSIQVDLSWLALFCCYLTYLAKVKNAYSSKQLYILSITTYEQIID